MDIINKIDEALESKVLEEEAKKVTLEPGLAAVVTIMKGNKILIEGPMKAKAPKDPDRVGIELSGKDYTIILSQ